MSEEYLTWEEKVLDQLERWVKYDKPITRKQAEETIDFICEQDNVIDRISNQRDKQKEIIDKIKELIERKLSTETYQHLKKLYDDIDSTEEIWEDYEFEDLLDILELLEETDV